MINKTEKYYWNMDSEDYVCQLKYLGSWGTCDYMKTGCSNCNWIITKERAEYLKKRNDDLHVNNPNKGE